MVDKNDKFVRDVHNSALAFDIERITTDDTGVVFWNYRAVIHAGDKDIDLLKVLKVDELNDYVGDYFPRKVLVGLIGKGTLIYDLEPFKDELEMTVYKSPTNNKSPVDELIVRYKAMFAEDVPNALAAMNSPHLSNAETGDLYDYTEVSFHVYELSMEHIVNAQVGTVVRATPPYAVVNTLVPQVLDTLRLTDEEKILGYEFYPPNNQTPRDVILIPDGTKVMELPDYLQNHEGGIYTTGLGFFIRSRIVHMWPLYNFKREEPNDELLQIILAPTAHFSIIQNTWFRENNTLCILGTGPITPVDDTQDQLANDGNVVRFMDAGQLGEGFVETKGNKAVMDRGKLNTEFSMVDTGKGLNVSSSRVKVTSNSFREVSRVASRAGIKVTLVWRFSDPDQIKPGMKCELMYDYKGDVRSSQCAILGVAHSTQMDGKGIVAQNWYTNTVVTIFIDRNDAAFVDYLKTGGGNSSPDSSKYL